ncbi:SDR family NAD(P)-dependent oxidoreductase [Leptothoe sp. LEGE 181152]|nr:SDR family NAD(P)-dependent oxidoreductase [Leptothoe sp. LEGE 181152]
MELPGSSNLIELLSYRAAYQPGQTAYTFLQDGEVESDQLSYQELEQQAQAIARQLLQITQPGARALLLYPPSLKFITAFLGCLYAGIVAVPANPPRRKQRRSRLGAIANDAQPAVVLTTTNIWQQLQKQSADYSHITHLAVLITEDIKPSQSLGSLAIPAITADTLAFLQYTSGSTGQPKGVMVSHGNVLHNSKLIQAVTHSSAASRSVSWLPVYHDMGLINGIFQPLYVGCQSILMSPTAFLQKPVRWLQAISKFRGTHGGAPDFAYQLCVQKIRPEQKAELDLSSWTVAYNGAEPIRAQIMAEFAAAFKDCGFQQRAFMPCYGLAEATLGVSWHPIDQVPKALTVSTSSLTAGQIEVVVETGSPQTQTQSLVSCGIPPSDLNVRIVNPQTGQRCAEGEIGEIWLAGESVAQGYWQQSDATQLTFQAYLEESEEGPFLRTGDLGGLVAGELIITGRLKDLIIIRGQNYYPQDIEQVAEASHPALQPGGGAAFSVEVGEQAQLVVLHEVKRSYLRQLNGPEVINAMRRAISETFDLQVQSVLLLKPNGILKTSSGKIQRRACRSAFLNGSLTAMAHEEFEDVKETQPMAAPHAEWHTSAPTTQDNNSHPTASQIHQWLVTQLAQHLNLEPGQISGDRPLAEYGLNSATAVGVSGELQDWLQRPLPVTLLYDYPTIAALSEYLSEPTSEKGNVPTKLRGSKGATETLTSEIAIIGIGCRFPNNINNAEDFWQLLQGADDVITTVPSTRWAIDSYPGTTHYGGFLEQVDIFDASFFGIAPREAISLDPQQRLLLEVSWEAIEDSVQAPSRLSGREIGVFIGISTHDYTRLLEQAGEVGPYFGTGNAFSTAAGRLSYSLGLTGPSVAIDTACSSSLVAVHNACQSLRLGECEQALAGGVNLILTAENSIALSEAQMLTPDGKCKTFDADANGYVRGEGCGVILLKRLSDALKDGDPIHAIIRGSAVNQDGRSNGLTAPNGLAQQQVIQSALLDAGVMPAEIDYVEAHGTGTALGDPIELTAIQTVMAAGQSSDQTSDQASDQKQQPLWVGSVKTNLGHLEAAAGIAGLIKVVQSLQHGQIPAHLHLQQPTPHFDWNGLQVPTQTRPWPEHQTGSWKAGVSSFGFSGTNAHVVLEAVSEKPSSITSPGIDRPLHLLGLSAATPEALSELCQKYCDYLVTHPEINLADLCFSANAGRSHFRQRLALTAVSVPELVKQLRNNSQASATVGNGSRAGVQQTPNVAFLFTGQGSQYAEMGRELYETQPLFRQILDHCNNSLRPYLDLDILQILYPNISEEGKAQGQPLHIDPRQAQGQPLHIDPRQAQGQPLQSDYTSPLNQTAYTQPILFALEYALYQLWQSWGITPKVVMGHSIGEIVAACVAGVFSLEDGLKLSAMRGQLMQQLPAGGAMVSVMAAVGQVKSVLAAKDDVTIAAINGPESTVISGEESAVQAVAQQLAAQGIKTKQLQVSHAFHSPLMAPILDKFEQVARQISYSLPQLKLISNVTGQVVTDDVATPEYWCRHILAPVNFTTGMGCLESEEINIFLECGPQPILLGMGRQCLSEDGEKAWLPSLRSGQSDWQQLLSSLGQLYSKGVDIDWPGFDRDYPQRRKVSLPTYPFQRQRYWVDTPKQQIQTASNSSSQVTELLDQGDISQLHQLLSTQNHSPIATETIEQLVKVHQQQLAAQSVQDLLYEVQWQQQAAPAIDEYQPHHWLIFTQSVELGDAIASQLHHHGQTSTLVTLAEELPQNNDHVNYVLQPDSPDAYARLWTHLSQTNTLPVAGILWLRSLEEINLTDLTADVLSRTVNQQCTELLHLMQSLVGQPELSQTKLWVLTQDGVALETDRPALVQAPVRGMGRIFGLEHPHQWGGLIDLDGQATMEHHAQWLTTEVLTNHTEEQVAYRRNHQRYVARLVRTQPKPDTPLTIDPESSYLLSGGLGGLGLTVAQWLVEQGARYLVLVSRQGANTPEKEAVIAQLRSQGCQVVMPVVDINDAMALQTTLSPLSESWPPMRGVIHAAGIDGDLHPIESLNQSTLAKTLAPKVKGSWNLHQLSLEWDLDFFVNFSSIAAVWGSAHQAHYGAANEFQNLLSHYRQGQGLPSLTVHWSAIAGSGMVNQADASQVKRLSEIGITPLSLPQMTATLGQLLSTSAQQCVVAAVDWQQFNAVYQTGRHRSLLDPLVEPESLAAEPPVQTDWMDQILSLPRAEQLERLKHTVQQEVARVLGLSSTSLPDPQVGFFELGMDSLMAVDLRSRLTQLIGVTLPTTVAFDFPNIEQLSRYLSIEVLQLTDQSQDKTTLPPQRQALDEPIAIVGMGCRLPGGIDSPEQFWQLLQASEDTRNEIPLERWDIDAYYDPDPEATGKILTRYGHFVEGVDQFDPSFFGISPREAVAIDPQHRLLLEVSWEALERAGQKVERLSEAMVGVFVGNDGHDYEQLLQQHLQQSPDSPLATYAGSGNHISSAAGRLAYTLGFTGPTMTLDTACSSSLVAVHQACNSLRLGECYMALAGGVKLHLTPNAYIGTSRARMISADGRCKTFDESANGYGRGEGCGMIVLKRLSEAERDGDPILALIRGSAVNQDGPSSGLTVPNGQAQQRLITQALTQAKVQPIDVSYLEAHGTGTSLGDPIELNAVMAVLGEDRNATQPLLIGSVKTNIGHLEAAAGISGLIKVVLSLQHQQIPAHLHLNTPNPKIDWQDWLQVPQELTPWNSPGQRLAGVSAFGFTGTNAHVVIEEAPMPTEIIQTPVDRPLQVLTISAKTEESLVQLAQRYHEYLESHPQQSLADVCFSASTGRLAHGHRLAVVAETGTAAAAQLSAFAAGQVESELVKGTLKTAETPKVAILFTGQGSQYVNMARELYNNQPTFKLTLDRCSEILNTYLDRPLLEILYPDESTEVSDALLNQTAYTQPALFAIEYALYQLWHSWGIVPSVVMGHSIGELVAACIAGVFSLEDGLKLSATRGKLMQQLPAGGAMVSVMASVERLSTFMTDNVTIAAINGPESTVISGQESKVLDIAQQLETQGIKTKQLQVSHAFHSSLMESMLDDFEQLARQISYSPPRLKLISNVTGQIVSEEVTTPDYWCRHILSTVNFAAGMERLQQEEINIFLECGPQPILLGMGRQCLPEDNEKIWLPSLRAGQNDWQQMLSSLSQLHVRGVKIDWIGFDKDYPQRRKIALPTYPFQRQRYWVDVPKHQSLLGQPHHVLVGNKLELASTGQTIYHQTINLIQYPWINDHRVYDTAVIPGVSYIAMTLATLELPATIESVHFLEPLFLASPNSERETELVIQPAEKMNSCRVDVFSRDATQQDQWHQHASLTVQDTPQLFSPLRVDIAHLQEQLAPITADTLNQLYGSISVTYGPMLAVVQQAWVGNGIALSEIMVPEVLASHLANEPIHPVLLDACTRLTADLFDVDHEPGVFWAPWQVDEVTLMRPAPQRFYAYVNQATRINEQLQTRAYDIHLLDETGQAFGRIDGFTLKRAPRERFLKYLQADTSQYLYQLQWQALDLQPQSILSEAGTWLLLVPTAQWAEQLKETLVHKGQSCVVVSLGTTFQQLDDHHYQVCPNQDDGFERLFQQLNEQSIALQGIVHLWSLTSHMEDLADSLKITCSSTLQLLQALISQEKSPTLWLVTQGSQCLSREQIPQIQQTPLWGLGRVIALEHPELHCHLLDLDEESAIAEAVQLVVKEALSADAENLVAYNQNQRYVARLKPYAADVETALASSQENWVQPDASYLITGGLGALGLQVAQWMKQSGATSLVLMGRRAPSETAAAIIHDLKQVGVTVSVVQADVANAANVARVLDEIDTQLPPLKGIVHAAGVLADGLLQNQNWPQFEQVMAAKVLGSWHLHQLTQNKPLDFFVCFSSAASLLGSLGQGNYAAANAFMDGLAHYRRAQGLPGLSINWGPWAGDGMAAQLNNSQLSRFEKAGFQPLNFEVGISILQQCLQLELPQVGVLPINWSQWSAQGTTATQMPLLRAVLPNSSKSSQTGWLRQQLETVPMEQRRALLMDQVQLQVAQILGITDSTTLDSHTGLFDMGIDSLMILELNNRLQACLGCQLSATDLFDYNTLDDLVNYLVQDVLQWSEDNLENQRQTSAETSRRDVAASDGAAHYSTEPIAIIGLGCRFPQSTNPADFWQLLEQGIDAVTEVPVDRWDIEQYYDPDPDVPGKMYTRYGSFLSDVDQFDATFFKISPREARSLDPQHRLLLEVCWESLEDAGVSPISLKGTQTGVFIGMMTHDYGQLAAQTVDVHTGSGNGAPLAAGRIAYTLGLNGPTLTVETACSSSLVACHLACQSLRNQESNLALVGGVNLMLTPEMSVLEAQAQMNSPDGRCKTFDNSADGYGRGEGCGIVVLKRLSDAQADGDQILALVRGSAVNHDGSSSGLTVPNGLAQKTLIEQALINANVQATQVDYVECHGTGTALGDPIEINSLVKAYGKHRDQFSPIMIGSVKTNIGHTEGAAGIAGLIKVILSLQHEKIPPHLHLKQPNQRIAWDEIPVVVPTTIQSWQRGEKFRLAGVSSFGLSGTNVHVIVEEAPDTVPVSESMERPWHILTLAAKTERALQDLVGQYETYINHRPELTLSDICYTVNTGRAHFKYRLAVAGTSLVEVSDQLKQLRESNQRDDIRLGQSGNSKASRLAMLFTGQGAQSVNMARELYETQPTFKQSLDQCSEILNAYLERPLLNVLYPDQGNIPDNAQDNDLLNQTAYTQPALFAIEYALYQLWQSWGIKPSVVMGHSIGEIVAACVADVFSLEDGLKLTAMRGQLMQQLPSGGAMVSVMASPEQVNKLMVEHVTIAAINGPESTVISGEESAVLAIAHQLETQGIKTKQLQVSHAFHSPLMAPMLTEFEQVARQISYSLPKLKLISNVTGQVVTDDVATPEYWCDHVLVPVNFVAGMERLRQEEIDIFLECGPRPILLGMARQCLSDDSAKVWLPSLRSSQSDWQQMLASLRELYVRGWDIDWAGFDQAYPQRRKVSLPTYPFQRQRYWVETAINATVHGSSLSQSAASLGTHHPLIAQKFQSPLSKDIFFESHFSVESIPFLADHRVFQQVVVPGACYLSLLLAAARLTFPQGTFQMTQVLFPQALAIAEEQARTVQTVLTPHQEGWEFQVISFNPSSSDSPSALQGDDHGIHSTGILSTSSTNGEFSWIEIQAIQDRCTQQVAGAAIYESLDQRHIQLGTRFQWMETAWVGQGEVLGQLVRPDGVQDDGYELYPGLLDACFQALVAVGIAEGAEETMQGTWVPFQMERFSYFARPQGERLWCHGQLDPEKEISADQQVWNLQLLDTSGQVVARINGFEVRQASREVILGTLQDNLQDWLYEIDWQPSKIEEITVSQESGTWLMFVPAGTWGEQLTAVMAQQQQHCICVSPGDDFQQLATDHYQVCPTQAKSFQQLLRTIAQANPNLKGVVHLWSLESDLENLEDSEDVFASLQLSCESALYLVQALASELIDEPPPLWLVTQNAQSLGNTHQVQQTPLWGLGQVVALEQPELHCRLLNLETASLKEGNWSVLIQELLNADSENRIAYHQGQRHGARLRQLNAKSPDSAVQIFQPQASYLITGGLGALGLQVAQWLAQQGAESLVLMGRRSPSEMAQAMIEDLEKTGIKVSIVQGDIAQKESLANILGEIDQQLPPLRGIVHAAGVLDDGLLQNQTWSRFEQVMAAKVKGSWHLHCLTQDKPLDFFILFSSAASLLGAPGQGNYAAANAFMDGLAHYRHGQGLPALSLNWGPWATGGMAQHLEKPQLDRLQHLGFQSIDIDRGMGAMAIALQLNQPQVGVISVNWSQWFGQTSMGATVGTTMPVLKDVAPLKSPGLQEGWLIRQLEALPRAQRRQFLIERVRSQLAQVLGISDPTQIEPQAGLFDLGIDSLMIAELRQWLQTGLSYRLSATALFNYNTIEDLVEYLTQQLPVLAKDEIPDDPPPAAAGPDDLDNYAEALDDLSEDELAAMLGQTLSEIQAEV